MLTALIIVSCLTLVLTYVTINLMKKVEELEDYTEKVNSAYASLSNKTKLVEKIMKESDVRGSFEADDEIGEAFKTIKDAVKELN